MSEYGGYGFRCCLLYQAPSNQLPPQLRDETEAQIDTTISFRTTGKDARFISEQHIVLPRHTFYVNTDMKTDDPTGSIMVDAYPLIREMQSEVQGVELMTDEEIEVFKRRAVERIGAVPLAELFNAFGAMRTAVTRFSAVEEFTKAGCTGP